MGVGVAEGVADGPALMTAEIVEDDEVAGLRDGTRSCSTQARKQRPLVGPSKT